MSEQHGDAHDPLNVTNPEHADHHIVSPVQYTAVYVTLLLLTGLTVWAAYWNMGLLNPIVALLIATIKASVVILFFMHAIYQSRLIKLTVASGFFLFLVLITMTLLDYMSRAWGAW